MAVDGTRTVLPRATQAPARGARRVTRAVRACGIFWRRVSALAAIGLASVPGGAFAATPTKAKPVKPAAASATTAKPAPTTRARATSAPARPAAAPGAMKPTSTAGGTPPAPTAPAATAPGTQASPAAASHAPGARTGGSAAPSTASGNNPTVNPSSASLTAPAPASAAKPSGQAPTAAPASAGKNAAPAAKAPAAAARDGSSPASEDADDAAAGPASPAPKPERPKRARSKIFESSTYEPELIYRMIGLTLRRDAVYHKEAEAENYANQVYLSLKFTRTFNYRDQVVLIPALRQKLKANTVEPIIEQGYIRTDVLPQVTLTAGKKTEMAGSGFLVNPSDLLNESRDIFDPLNQREGRTFTRLMWQGDWAGFGLGYIPEQGNSVEKGRSWALLNLDVLKFDIRAQFTGSESDKLTSGISVVRFLGDSFELHVDARHQARQRDETVQPERPFSSYQKEDPSSYVLVGDRIIFSGKRSLVTEYVHNQSGLARAELEAFYRAEEEKEEDRRDLQKRLLGRRYAYLAYSDEDTFASEAFGFSVAGNLDDGSAFGSLLWRHKWSPITSVEFQPTFFSGKTYAEFGETPYKYLYYLTFKGRF